MSLIEPADISLEVTPLVQTPKGFLRSRLVGLEPDARFDEVLTAIVEAVEGHLSAYGITSGSNPRHRLAAQALGRYYAAEQVLTVARTGSVKDPEGASVSLSSGDLAHWTDMRREAWDRAGELLGPLPGPARSGVFFPSVRLRSERR